jgi:hypothetical protein
MWRVRIPGSPIWRRKFGGDRVSVSALSQGNWNPHFVVARPSLIARAREADLLIINGAHLEIGWLPPVVRESRNPNIQQGSRGLLDLSTAVGLIDKPVDVSRAGGDVHPDGNPHYALDPHNILPLAATVAARLALIDPEGSAMYESNLSVFQTDWKKRLAAWDSRLSGLKGVKTVSYHSLYNYFIRRYGIVLVGTVEPLPGIPPSSRHMDRSSSGRAPKNSCWCSRTSIIRPGLRVCSPAKQAPGSSFFLTMWAQCPKRTICSAYSTALPRGSNDERDSAAGTPAVHRPSGIHSYFGIRIIRRGIIFTDLAIGQMAALGAPFPFSFSAGRASIFRHSLSPWQAAPCLGRIAPLHPSRGGNRSSLRTGNRGVFMLLSRSPHGMEEFHNLMAYDILFTGMDKVLETAILYAALGAVIFVTEKKAPKGWGR